MKKRLFVFGLLSMLFSSCLWSYPEESTPESAYTAETLTRSALESSVQLMPPQDIIKSGKIYISESLMIVNDVNRGFQIYNYSDPESPVAVAFLNVPGATDLAMRGTTMYINQAVDLVSITYTTGNNTIAVQNRNRNVFPQKPSPDGYPADVENDEIVVNWTPNN